MDLTGTASKTSSAGTAEWLMSSKDIVISAYDSAPMLLGKAELFLRGDLLNERERLMVTYGLYGAVIVIVLLVLLFGGRVIVDTVRQKKVKGTSQTYP